MSERRHEPCPCNGRCASLPGNLPWDVGDDFEPDPFRCAVERVIFRFEIDPYCACRAQKDRPLCIACELRGQRREDHVKRMGFCPLPAFLAASPPYKDFTRLYARLACSAPVEREPGIVTLRTDHAAGARRLLDAAPSDPIAHDAAILLLGELCLWDMPIPPELLEFEVHAIKGRIEQPKAKAKDPRAREDRDRAIVELVREAKTLFGLTPKSGSKPETSACAAVAEALRRMRLEPDSLGSIEGAWKARNQRRG